MEMGSLDSLEVAASARTIPKGGEERPASELCRELCRIGGFEGAALFLGNLGGATERIGSFGDHELELAPCREAGGGGPLLRLPLVDQGREVGFFLMQQGDADDAEGGEFMADFARVAGIALRTPSIPLGVARYLHDTVVQRLSGLSFLLAADEEAVDVDQIREEIAGALGELRVGLEESCSGGAEPPRPSMAGEIKKLMHDHAEARLAWDRDSLDDLRRHQPLVETTIAEGIRNAREHAAPTQVVIELDRGEEATTVTVRNDGVGELGGGGCGMGLRLLAMEASLAGGLIEANPDEEDGWWRLRLILPSSA